MIKLTPFLLFDGNCAEAMTFYHQCLGGELTLTKLGDTTMKDQYPKEKHGSKPRNPPKGGFRGSGPTTPSLLLLLIPH